MTPNAARAATSGRGGRPAGVSFPADARRYNRDDDRDQWTLGVSEARRSALAGAERFADSDKAFGGFAINLLWYAVQLVKARHGPQWCAERLYQLADRLAVQR